MDIDELVAACREAVTLADPTAEVSAVLAMFLDQPGLEHHVGRGDRSTYEALHRGDDLLLLHAVVPPTPKPVAPHDHRMWAVVAVYQGSEHNQLYTRGGPSGLESTEQFELEPGEVRVLDPTVIHSVQAKGDRYLGALHVYGGDLFSAPRSSWPNGVEQPMDESSLPVLIEMLRQQEDALGRPMTRGEAVELLASPRA